MTTPTTVQPDPVLELYELAGTWRMLISELADRYPELIPLFRMNERTVRTCAQALDESGK